MLFGLYCSGEAQRVLEEVDVKKKKKISYFGEKVTETAKKKENSPTLKTVSRHFHVENIFVR